MVEFSLVLFKSSSSSNPSPPMMQNAHSRRPLPRWKRALFRCLAVVLPILGLEAAARIYWVQFIDGHKSDSQLYQEALGEKVLDDEVPYQFFPNREFVVAQTPTKTNNLRLRGDYDVDPDQDFEGTRIMCIGDSVTFGYCVSGNPAAYPAVLESTLQQRGVQCQVLNAGMPRFRMQHLAKFFDDQLRHYDPDFLVILGGWNNANDHVLRPTGDRSWKSILEQNWYLLKVVRHSEILPQLGGRQHIPAVVEAAGILEYGDALEQLIQLARQSGAEPVLCTLPHFFHNLNDQAARDKAATFTPLGTLTQLAETADAMNEQIHHLGQRVGVPVIELDGIDDHIQFGDAIHPNDDGSAMIAELVAAYLLQNKLVAQH